MTESEVWRDVAGYDGRYQVSDKGNVYSVERIGANGRKCGGITLKPRPTINGYFQVVLCKNGVKKSRYIHRLVAEAFITNPNNHPEVNHKDENKSNNELSNVEWCDSSYNTNYGTRNKKISQIKSKKVRAVNVETGEVLTFNLVKEAIRKGYSGAGKACRGVYNYTGGDGHTYRGYKWSYE